MFCAISMCIVSIKKAKMEEIPLQKRNPQDDQVTSIIKEMGRKPQALLSTCIQDVSNLRASVQRSQRIITLAPLAHSSSFREHSDEFPNTFKSYVFNPQELPSFLGFAQMTQNTGFLICFINENPEILASAVLSKTKSADFTYLIRCAIPAAFGYFSSHEHLCIAINFYRAIVENCDQKLAISILQPLMHSASTFRFVEAAFTKFTRALAVDGKANENEDYNPGFLSMYSKFLVECIVNSLPLLPEQILCLLRYLKDLKWHEINFGNLFFNKFLWKYAIEWISHSPAKKYSKLLEKVISIISKNDSQISEIYKTLFTCKSVYELPHIYKPFGHMYLDFYISVHDIHVLAKFLHSCKKMPETVTIAELKRVPEKFEYNWYSCQVYPHIPSQNIEYNDEPIFEGESQEIKILEKLLCHRLYRSELEKWNDLTDSCLSVVIDPFISEAVVLPQNRQFRKMFRSLEKSFNLPRLNRKLYLSLLEMHLQTWIDLNKIAILDHLDSEFSKLLLNIQNRDGMIEFTELTSKTHESLRPTMMDSIKTLSCLEKASLYDQFQIMINVMHDLRFIQQIEQFPDKFYAVIFQQCNIKNFLSIFIKLNSFAMRNPYFKKYCDDDEIILWLKIESVILFCLRPDEVFIQAYIKLQQDFIDTALKYTQA
ncbi:hypothetical protein TRFO_38411 [Tritrichomonas foetus]|uniref:Uncharacterized protein n=1 Tax=Tritrichomonas foetus TaxID=1144522 RepID=A0A1J4J8H3_9EUKA|nr:hypothetical protein TRFO_38411 [Tritrichomonas foetus]|eukprot:OHS95490.1 hypothetical protein TRFO_38411 [Tritrichomonas foetus]